MWAVGNPHSQTEREGVKGQRTAGDTPFYSSQHSKLWSQLQDTVRNALWTSFMQMGSCESFKLLHAIHQHLPEWLYLD